MLQVVFGAVIGVYTGTYILMAQQRSKKDIFNHLVGGALGGAVGSALFGDFSFKGLSRRVVGVALCTSLYSQAVRIEEESVEFRTTHGREITREEQLSLFVSSIRNDISSVM